MPLKVINCSKNFYAGRFPDNCVFRYVHIADFATRNKAYEESIALFALSIKQQYLISKPASNMGKSLIPGCENSYLPTQPLVNVLCM